MRVAPTTKQSIPRLELLGALILARLVNTVLKNCPQKLSVTCWVEIQTTLSKEHWNYYPGSLNPADLPSRGLDANMLVNCNLWWEGPPFLKDSILINTDPIKWNR